MPSVRDLAARLGDSLKNSEFRNHPNLYKMDEDPQELRRIQWVRYLDMLEWKNVHPSRMCNLHSIELRIKDEKDYILATALCKKLKLPFKSVA